MIAENVLDFKTFVVAVPAPAMILADKSAVGAVNRPLRLVACQRIIHTPADMPLLEHANSKYYYTLL